MALAAVFAQQAVAKNHTKTAKTASKKHKKHNKKVGAAPVARGTQALS